MTIWADADSLPREVKELIGRRAGTMVDPSHPGSAGNTGDGRIRAVFVANRPIPLPPGKNLQAVTVGPAGASARPADAAGAPHGDPAYRDGAMTADDYIIGHACPHDILVTRDIPLAARAIGIGVIAINDRGDLWTADSVRERLSLRNHMESLREAGIAPPSSRARSFSPKEARAFAGALDKAIHVAIAAQRA
ncbi:MAG TPA: DUF188 domain-containing protein [bacterium]|nr:DUF188 domain-containing protein [bacterium]